MGAILANIGQIFANIRSGFVNIREYSSMFVPVVDCISSVFRIDLSLLEPI